MFVNDLETAGLVVTTGHRARRHRARNPQIALPRMGQLVASGPLFLALRLIARAFSIQ